jgi:hypothetical protein
MNSKPPDICVLCAIEVATTREHTPAELFFGRPLPDNLITVPSCVPCNQGSQRDDEYLRAFMMLLRDCTPSSAIEGVRARTIRQLNRQDHPGLRISFEKKSELRWDRDASGQPIVGLFTKPDRDRLWKVLTKYARGLYFWSTGNVVPHGAQFSIERLFNREMRPDEYWEPLLAAAAYARAGTVVTTGSHAEFQYSFRIVEAGDVISVMVLDFYRSFSYVAMVLKPGTDLSNEIRVPF